MATEMLNSRKNTLSGKDVIDHATLMRQISIEAGVSIDVVHRVIESLWSSIRKNLIMGYRVRVHGLGTFMRLQKFSQSLSASNSGTGRVTTIISLDNEMKQSRIERID